jgi:hypothetical protein
MGRHQIFSRALLVEAVVLIASLAVVVPRFGVIGAACTIATLLILNRGLFTAFLMSRELHVGYGWFLASVYQPLIAAVPVGILLYVIRVTILPGKNWAQLILAGAIVVVCYAPLAFFFSVQPAHRQLVLDQLHRFGPTRSTQHA